MFGSGVSKEMRKVERGHWVAPIPYDCCPYKEMRTQTQRNDRGTDGHLHAKEGGCRRHRATCVWSGTPVSSPWHNKRPLC